MTEWDFNMEEAKTGEDVLLYFPLPGLSEHHPKRIIGHYHDGLWVWQGRALRGYSVEYQPACWQPLPSPPKET